MNVRPIFTALCSTPLAFALPEGFEMNTFAEPFEVDYPTALTAAGDGTVYVSVDHNGSLGKLPKMGKIVSCRDTDGDGKADQFVDFVASVDSPRGGHFVGDTLYLIHPPFLSSFRDTTGDGVADEHKVLLENIGFGLRHPRGSDHTTNGCRMGIDGWLYIAVGDFGMEGTKGTDGRVVIHRGGAVARVRPDGSDLEIYSYNMRNICDVAISPYLDLFTRDNTNDGKGWNIRVHHFTNGSDHGYPRLYKNFTEEAIRPMQDQGGGSGTGALYLHEPGFPEAYSDLLLTCDWTTGRIYEHELGRFEATYTSKEREFMKLVRATDIDVDGESNLYVCDWRNGKFKYAGDGVKIGLVQRIVHKDTKVEKWPDLKKASDGELMSNLMHRSAVRRLETQREILRRGRRSEMAKLLMEAAKESAPLYAKVAAVFTLKQLFGAAANGQLLELVEDAEIREFVLRALADRKAELDGVPGAVFQTALADPNPRVRLQAVVGLRRLNAKSAAPDLIKLAAADWAQQKDVKEGEQLILPHHAVRALAAMGAWEACLGAVNDPQLRTPALRALQLMHEARVVEGLVALVSDGTDRGLRLEVMATLARLFHREAKWDLKQWWGTRPDDRGPYFAPETWDQTAKIQKALESGFAMLSSSDKPRLLDIFAKNRIDVSKMKLGDSDPVMIALGMPQPNAGQLLQLRDAALDQKRRWESRTECYRALGRGDERQVLGIQIGVLAAWLNEKGRVGEAEREISDFINSPALILKLKDLTKLARKENAEISRIAWRTILTFAHSPLIKERFRERAMKITRDNPREVGFFVALVDLKIPGYEKEIKAAIESDNDELIAAAERAMGMVGKAIFREGRKVAALETEVVAKIAMSAKGDVSLGKELFTRAACVTCHAVDLKEVQKGPYLGSAGTKFTRDYLIQSVLEPGAVVAPGFQTVMLKTRNRKSYTGFITQEQDGMVEVRDIAGMVSKVKASEIKSRKQLSFSMMPVGLVGGMTTEEFAALIEYLASLKEK
jgi:putative heme-binding domain-containing protein